LPHDDSLSQLIVGHGPSQLVSKIRVIVALMKNPLPASQLVLGHQAGDERREGLPGGAPRVVSGMEVREMLGDLTVAWPPEYEFSSTAELAHVRASVRFPIVLKSESGLAHRREAGGIIPDLSSWAQLEAGVALLLDKFGGRVLLAEQVRFVSELFVGMENRRDGLQILVIGRGGAGLDASRDVSVRLWPMPDQQLRSLLSLYVDSDDLITRLSEFISALALRAVGVDGIASIDINPLVVSTTGSLVVLDAKVHVSSGAL
jgi:succinyl-CoA synthetase beta subunit